MTRQSVEQSNRRPWPIGWVLSVLLVAGLVWVVLVMVPKGPVVQHINSPSSPPASLATSPSPSQSADDFAAIKLQTSELTQAYYLLLPSDTATVRKQRLLDAGLTEHQLASLNLEVGMTSCGDQARLEQSLVERAIVNPNTVQVQTLPGTPARLYVTVQGEVKQFTDQGRIYPGTKTCLSALPIAAFTSWELVEGSWKLTAFGPREVIL